VSVPHVCFQTSVPCACGKQKEREEARGKSLAGGRNGEPTAQFHLNGEAGKSDRMAYWIKTFSSGVGSEP
ncbi:MAG: hypothetical protein VYA46_06925, partial [Verrucomicrobiota bacterium]|nr:hypothetical protein [Verrucomicrobiota bacterium]